MLSNITQTGRGPVQSFGVLLNMTQKGGGQVLGVLSKLLLLLLVLLLLNFIRSHQSFWLKPSLRHGSDTAFYFLRFYGHVAWIASQQFASTPSPWSQADSQSQAAISIARQRCQDHWAQLPYRAARISAWCLGHMVCKYQFRRGDCHVASRAWTTINLT
jgi:hypothetical protein